MFRLNAASRSLASVKDDLQGENAGGRFFDYCLYDDAAGAFAIPSRNALSAFRVVVSTCCSAALIRAAGVPEGHFTHVFVDEAGHAVEPELLIPLMAARGAQVVLSGDPKQLGPIVRCEKAKAKVRGSWD